MTPRRHPDHLSMFSLLHSTEMVIRVLQSVKLREMEYLTIKTLATKIQGLPMEFELASRERRLIAQGPLLKLRPSAGDLIDEIITLRTPIIRKYDVGPPLTNPASPHPPYSPVLRTVSEHSVEKSPPRRRFDKIVTHDVSGKVKGPVTRAGEPEGESKFEEDGWIYAFVFTDVVVLAETLEWTAPVSKHHPMNSPVEDSWDLLADIGLARVLGFSDLSTQTRTLFSSRHSLKSNRSCAQVDI